MTICPIFAAVQRRKLLQLLVWRDTPDGTSDSSLFRTNFALQSPGKESLRITCNGGITTGRGSVMAIRKGSIALTILATLGVANPGLAADENVLIVNPPSKPVPVTGSVTGSVTGHCRADAGYVRRALARCQCDDRQYRRGSRPSSKCERRDPAGPGRNNMHQPVRHHRLRARRHLYSTGRQAARDRVRFHVSLYASGPDGNAYC